ncbi:hypothetical protein Dimus_027559, partial [Dionaea muscipula]
MARLVGPDGEPGMKFHHYHYLLADSWPASPDWWYKKAYPLPPTHPAAPWYAEPEDANPPSSATLWPTNSLRWREDVILQLRQDLNEIQERYMRKLEQSKKELEAYFEQSDRDFRALKEEIWQTWAKKGREQNQRRCRAMPIPVPSHDGRSAMNETMSPCHGGSIHGIAEKAKDVSDIEQTICLRKKMHHDGKSPNLRPSTPRSK